MKQVPPFLMLTKSLDILFTAFAINSSFEYSTEIPLFNHVNSFIFPFPDEIREWDKRTRWEWKNGSSEKTHEHLELTCG